MRIWFRLSPILFALFGVVACTTQAIGEERGWFSRNFIDEDDGALDTSEWLGKGGFLPLPIIVTEPAVDNGLGLAFGFVGKGDPATKTPPSLTGIAGVFTGNQSEFYALFHEGTYVDGRLKLSGLLASTDVNLDFFAGGNRPFSYNIDGVIASATGAYRLAQSNWFLGGTWRYLDSEVKLTVDTPSSLLPSKVDATLSGLGLVLDYYSLDNVFTPTQGISSRLSAVRFDSTIGSDFDFSKYAASIFAYTSPTKRLTLGGKLVGETVSDTAPFFVLPAINLRGIPAVRYQGNSAISSEAEMTYQFASRWRAVGFAGAGWADNENPGADNKIHPVYGAGIRYRIARKLGIDLGLDVARGPEDTVIYIQFGRAWRRF